MVAVSAPPQGVAAEAGADVHPQRVVAERGALGGRGGGGPGANPMPIVLHRISLRTRTDPPVARRPDTHEPTGLSSTGKGLLSHVASQGSHPAERIARPRVSTGGSFEDSTGVISC